MIIPSCISSVIYPSNRAGALRKRYRCQRFERTTTQVQQVVRRSSEFRQTCLALSTGVIWHLERRNGERWRSDWGMVFVGWSCLLISLLSVYNRGKYSYIVCLCPIIVRMLWQEYFICSCAILWLLSRLTAFLVVSNLSLGKFKLKSNISIRYRKSDEVTHGVRHLREHNVGGQMENDFSFAACYWHLLNTICVRVHDLEFGIDPAKGTLLWQATTKNLTTSTIVLRTKPRQNICNEAQQNVHWNRVSTAKVYVEYYLTYIHLPSNYKDEAKYGIIPLSEV